MNCEILKRFFSRGTSKPSRMNQTLLRRISRGKRKPRKRVNYTSFLKITEEKSFCLSTMQVMAAKMASSGLYLMNVPQKNVSGLQKVESEQSVDCVKDLANFL